LPDYSELFDGDLTEGEETEEVETDQYRCLIFSLYVAHCVSRIISTKKVRWRGSRRMNADAGTRLVKKLVERMKKGYSDYLCIYFSLMDSPSSQVEIPFNFRRASKRQKQLGGQPFAEMLWDDDTPRQLVSEDGYSMVVSMPKLMGERGTVSRFYAATLGRNLMRTPGRHHG
jgi:hypothetical protein